MRSLILALLTTTVTIVSATTSQCVHDIFEDIASRTSFGDNSLISTCLGAKVDIYEIRQCFIDGGYSQSKAAAVWIAHECNLYELSDVPDIPDELKRRAESSGTTEAATTETNTAKTSAKTAKTTESAPASTTAPSSTEATTTSDSSASSAAASTTATTETTASSTTSDSSTTSSQTTTTGSTTSATTTGTLLCSTTNVVSTSVCSISNGQTIGCSPTMTAIGTCAAGNLCTTNTAGDPICMKKDDHLTTSGLIVIIVFAIGIVGFSIGMVIMNFMARRNRRRAELERAALLGGGRNGKGRAMSDVEAVRAYSQAQGARSEANIPLITPGGSRSDQQQYPQQDYFEHTPRGSNNGSPNEPGRGNVPPVPQIQLHQGLGALGQDSYR